MKYSNVDVKFTCNSQAANVLYLHLLHMNDTWMAYFLPCTKSHYMNHIFPVERQTETLYMYVATHCIGHFSASSELNQLYLGD